MPHNKKFKIPKATPILYNPYYCFCTVGGLNGGDVCHVTYPIKNFLRFLCIRNRMIWHGKVSYYVLMAYSTVCEFVVWENHAEVG